MSVKPKETTASKEFIPETIRDVRGNRMFARGKLMGKGGFAKCYELTDLETKQILAGKIVPKSLLVKQSQKDKMAQEVQIHRSLNHPNIVKFYTFFEDEHNVYITLELCRRRSLMEMHKRRKAFTEPEARYFLKQIATACKYLHENQIIHRDLKLGNLFLNDEMELKVGDFGLATKLDHQGERKKTLCGTPNYIAPEVLNKSGHSFEVDVWSLGCILFTLLVGKPPFETNSLKETYLRIKKNEYWIPHKVSPQARSLIQKMLYPDPTKRPTMDAILKDPFMKSGYLPSRLPTSCLTMAPRFDQRTDFSICVTSPSPRPPLIEVNDKVAQEKVQLAEAKTPLPAGKSNDDVDQSEKDLKDILKQLTTIMDSRPSNVEHAEDEAEDPAAAPMLWISKWVDYSDKYGLGYQLCDNSVGVIFNDVTKLILLADGENLHYIERDGSEHYHVISQYPPELQKKVTLVKYFRSYMQEHLLKAGPPVPPRDGDELIRLPYLRTWFRTRSAIVLYLTNGTLQVNFFQDHSKIIICPVMNAVTYINEQRDFRTFRLNAIEKTGCSKELLQRLRYARTMVDKLLTSKTFNIPYINKKPSEQ